MQQADEITLLSFDLEKISDRLLSKLADDCLERRSAVLRFLHDDLKNEQLRRIDAKLGIQTEPTMIRVPWGTPMEMTCALDELEDLAGRLEFVAAMADDRTKAEMQVAIELAHAVELVIAGQRDGTLSMKNATVN